ncbi:hypothetical protein GP2143_02954 [marine gamma proteobacterium HTCC2143]|uniref:Peptidase M10 serralysin C-terminal domain-containing protein n=1 Tax=marine gamma proteobacterium HTCC2143 TaxID=247633 RepID=A0YEL2_9GAMM|nr:hypothetical protein GP2143_02954 [marine gamma proteobacterium HTCC2143]
MIINFKDNSTDSIKVQYQFYYENNTSDKQYHRIESIEFAGGSDVVDLTKLKFINNNNIKTWYGDSSDNNLIGVGDDDIMIGGDGNDTLTGNDGADILSGGSGADSFNYSSLEDSSINVMDEIEDFEQGSDKINLSEIEEDLSFDSFEFVVENGHTVVKDKNSDFAIDLQGEFALIQEDFIF